MWVMSALVVAVVLAAIPVAAEDVAKFWEDNCAGCHTIGGGASGGPDLQSVTTRRDRDWLIRFVLDPEAFASDPEVARMIKEADGMAMSATPGLTRELAAELLTFIEQRSGPSQAAAPPVPEPPVTAADVARGRDLFLGASPLAADGPACIACHEVGALPGGHLGPDLTRVHERLGGGRGLLAWLGTTPTPMMRAVYRPAALTPDEARALTAFLGESATAEGARPPRLRAFVVGGFGGAAAVLVLVGVVWANRFRGVRRPLVAAARGVARVGVRHAPGAAAMRPPRSAQIETTDLGGQR
jgi:mono/diheme cytochrome c family protein